MKIIDEISGKELDSGQLIFQDQDQKIEISYIVRLGRGVLVRNGDWISSPKQARKEFEKYQILEFLVVADELDEIVISRYHAKKIQQQQPKKIQQPDFKKLAAGDDS